MYRGLEVLPLDRLGEFFKGAFGAISAKMLGFKTSALTAVALQAFFFFEKMVGFKSGALAAGFFFTFFAAFFYFYILFFLGKMAGFHKLQWRCWQRTSDFLLFLYVYIYYILPPYSF
jgi:hypothetical protein